MADSQVKAAQQIGIANKAQTSQALIVQTYANSVDEQPAVDFSGELTLQAYQNQINSGLITAQGHANTYLNVIQPNIIQNIANIGNYYALNNAVATTLPAGSTEEEWIQALTALQIQSSQYQIAANGIVTSLRTLHGDLTADTASFATTVTELNAAVNGDNGVLKTIDQELSSIQGKIDGAIAGIVTSALAVVGGAFIIVVGSVADFVTAGTSTPIVVGGVGILATGIGGEVASAVVLSSLNNQKAHLLTEEASLTAEVKLATGISSSYQSLLGQVTNAVEASTEMETAWLFLSSELGSLISDLQNGIQSAGKVQEMFLTAANTEVQTVIADINTIKGQMAGVASIASQPGQTVSQALMAAAQQSVAA